MCICFVQKVIFLDEYTNTHYKMTRILFLFVALIKFPRGTLAVGGKVPYGTQHLFLR